MEAGGVMIIAGGRGELEEMQNVWGRGGVEAWRRGGLPKGPSAGAPRKWDQLIRLRAQGAS